MTPVERDQVVGGYLLQSRTEANLLPKQVPLENDLSSSNFIPQELSSTHNSGSNPDLPKHGHSASHEISTSGG